ncbi:hypothetical protein ABK040_001559 [Willaertia magna]
MLTTESKPFEECFVWGLNNSHFGLEKKAKEDDVHSRIISLPTRVPLECFLKGGEKLCLIALGGSHTVLITNTNRIFVLGKNQNGQLGLGHNDDVDHPTELKFEPFLEDNVYSVSCGDRHTIFLTKKGKLYSCGSNFNGQLGLGHNSNVNTPKLCDVLSCKKAISVVCGSRHTVLITGKGKLYTVGSNAFGQLGHGDFKDQCYFKKIENMDWNCIQCSCRENVNVCLSSNFSVYTWGGKMFNGSGENTRNVPTLVMHNLNGRRIVQVSASSIHALARTSDGNVYCWGLDLDNAGYVRFLKNLELTDKNLMEKNRPMVHSEEVLAEKHLDLSPKFVIHRNDVSIYRNHFFGSNKIVFVSCTETCNFCISEKGEVLVFGRGEYGETGLGKVHSNESVDFPTKVAQLEEKFVARLITSGHSVFALTGDAENLKEDFYLHLEKKEQTK